MKLYLSGAIVVQYLSGACVLQDLEKQAFDLAREKQAIEEQLSKFQEDKEVTMRLLNLLIC